MLKLVVSVVLLSCAFDGAYAQPASSDSGQLKLAGDALEAMGEKLHLAQLDQIWRASFVSPQVRLHHFSAAQAEAFFQMIRPSLAAQDQRLFEVRQRSLATAFTHDELLTTTAFYKSPVGQKLVRNERQVAPELAAAQGGSFKSVFAHIMAAGDAKSSVADKPPAPAPGQLQ